MKKSITIIMLAFCIFLTGCESEEEKRRKQFHYQKMLEDIRHKNAVAEIARQGEQKRKAIKLENERALKLQQARAKTELEKESIRQQFKAQKEVELAKVEAQLNIDRQKALQATQVKQAELDIELSKVRNELFGVVIPHIPVVVRIIAITVAVIVFLTTFASIIKRYIDARKEADIAEGRNKAATEMFLKLPPAQQQAVAENFLGNGPSNQPPQPTNPRLLR